MIEERLKRMNLRVDVLFPNEEVPLGKVVSKATNRQCPYRIPNCYIFFLAFEHSLPWLLICYTSD